MKHYLIIFFLVAIAVSCSKEKTYIYEVNNVDVHQPTNTKGTAKSTTEFISIAYSDLFNTTISDSALLNIFTAYSSFGDKKLIEDRIVRTFLDNSGIDIPTAQVMRNDVALFVTNAYKKIFNRAPTEYEKYYVKNVIQSDTAVTPSMVYYSLMTSNEYRYY